MEVSPAVTVLANAGVAVSSTQVAPEGLLTSTFIRNVWGQDRRICSSILGVKGSTYLRGTLLLLWEQHYPLGEMRMLLWLSLPAGHDQHLSKYTNHFKKISTQTKEAAIKQL